ncbi:putative RNA-directed DNA polymerase from transposon X-element [Trichonephila clavipes]|nr:putative RNA-directed DNA polymerase from transposon X-element [Trichonephila clavipes]
MSVPSHPLKPFALAIGLNRLYEARSFNIKPFSKRAKAVLNDAHLNNINIQENNILAFPPWDIQIFNYYNPFSGYDKAGTADVIYQQLFSFHRSKYSKYIPVYTDGSKTAGHNADTPTVIEILLLLRKLERKGFDIIFSWVPGHVDILGNEQADTAARSMSDHMQRPVCYHDLKTSAQNYIHRVWQETWDQQVLNKLHSIHPSTSHWAALPVRRHDVHLTRLRIGHTRFTHRHLLLGENAPECPSTSGLSTSVNSNLDNVVTTVLLKKPPEEVITFRYRHRSVHAFDDVADHFNDDYVCMAHVTTEESSTSTFFEIVNDKYLCDLGSFMNKILNDKEKLQILDMGPL